MNWLSSTGFQAVPFRHCPNLTCPRSWPSGRAAGVLTRFPEPETGICRPALSAAPGKQAALAPTSFDEHDHVSRQCWQSPSPPCAIAMGPRTMVNLRQFHDRWDFEAPFSMHQLRGTNQASKQTNRKRRPSFDEDGINSARPRALPRAGAPAAPQTGGPNMAIRWFGLAKRRYSATRPSDLDGTVLQEGPGSFASFHTTLFARRVGPPRRISGSTVHSARRRRPPIGNGLASSAVVVFRSTYT